MAPATDKQQLVLKNMLVSSINSGQDESDSTSLPARAERTEIGRALACVTEHVLPKVIRSGSPDQPGHDGNAVPNEHKDVSADNSNSKSSSVEASVPRNPNRAKALGLVTMHNPFGTSRTSTIADSNDTLTAITRSGAATSGSPTENDTSDNMSASISRGGGIALTDNAVNLEHPGVIVTSSNSGNSTGPQKTDAEERICDVTRGTEKDPNIDNIETNLIDDEESWNLQLISSKSPECQNLANYCRGFKIEEVYAVRNKMIDERYCDAVAAALEKDKFKGFHSVWHGTTSEDGIVRAGFGVGGVDVRRKHGAVMGPGVYVTTKPLRASRYSMKSSPKGRKFFCMLFCELCETVDTVTQSGETTFVQPDKRLVRPLYVVHFSRSR